MKIVRMSPFEQPKIVASIASVYQQSFGNEPWNEGYLCPVCGSAFAHTLSLQICPMCVTQSRNVLLVEYWPTSKIISDFYREMKKSGSICVVAQSDEVAIGFAWGYTVSSEPSLDTHLDAPGLHKSIQGEFFYLDECALLPAHQGKGIGKLLVRHIFNEQQQRKVLLRTMDDSRMCNLIKHMGGKIIQRISRERVIMRLITS